MSYLTHYADDLEREHAPRPPRCRCGAPRAHESQGVSPGRAGIRLTPQTSLNRTEEIEDEGKTESTRVLVADDHDLFRVGLASALATYQDIEVIAQASSGRMAVRLAAELRPDVILMDLRMPHLDGLEATREILKADPSARVVALTVTAGEADVAAAIMAGASGYVIKDSPIDDVVAAMRAAMCGTAWLSPRAARAALDRMRRERVVAGAASETPRGELSPRERQVLELVARGLGNNEIAMKLCISPWTAKNHVSSILGKLGVTNRIQAAVYWRRGMG